MPFISLLGAGLNWQLMIMSATMSEELVDIYRSLYASHCDRDDDDSKQSVSLQEAEKKTMSSAIPSKVFCCR
jgi:hypothetical protein